MITDNLFSAVKAFDLELILQEDIRDSDRWNFNMDLHNLLRFSLSRRPV